MQILLRTPGGLVDRGKQFLHLVVCTVQLLPVNPSLIKEVGQFINQKQGAPVFGLVLIPDGEFFHILHVSMIPRMQKDQDGGLHCPACRLHQGADLVVRAAPPRTLLIAGGCSVVAFTPPEVAVVGRLNDHCNPFPCGLIADLRKFARLVALLHNHDDAAQPPGQGVLHVAEHPARHLQEGPDECRFSPAGCKWDYGHRPRGSLEHGLNRNPKLI